MWVKVLCSVKRDYTNGGGGVGAQGSVTSSSEAVTPQPRHLKEDIALLNAAVPLPRRTLHPVY
ncbi:hypothetical protein E2C01_016926 [Portunus trituberculatus]|uniref:Uncharacterized protein n=1 Tax=Portunus trituberculatus TaxID=210409 RepID=A0A5B7DRY8_PORTR|nr:hypothetical protein [Portunus trituberculatus]